MIWAAWADRVSFDYILEQTGLREGDVIALMRRHLKGSSFRRWRARVNNRSTKHRRRFVQQRRDWQGNAFTGSDSDTE